MPIDTLPTIIRVASRTKDLQVTLLEAGPEMDRLRSRIASAKERVRI